MGMELLPTSTLALPKLIGSGSEPACAVELARFDPKMVTKLPGETVVLKLAPSVTAEMDGGFGIVLP